MSLLADEQSRRGMPAHLRVNGDPVIRLPKNGTPETLPGGGGVWNEYSEDQLSSQRPQRTTAEGLEVIRHGVLLLPVSQVVADDDQYKVLGELWQVQRIGAICGGYREVYLQRDDKTRTSKPAPASRRVI